MLHLLASWGGVTMTEKMRDDEIFSSLPPALKTLLEIAEKLKAAGKVEKIRVGSHEDTG